MTQQSSDGESFFDSEEYAKWFGEAINKVQQAFNAQFTTSDFDRFRESWEWEKAFSFLLTNYGWYIDPQMKIEFVTQIFDALSSKQKEIVDDILIEYYRNNTNEIQIVGKYPERKMLLEEAFVAHKSKMYFSSTILFLSQADGILGGHMFHKRYKLKELIEKHPYAEFISAVIGNNSAINANTVNKSNYFSELNRHEVMHGKYCEYGKETNSLKAISLLSFISYFF